METQYGDGARSARFIIARSGKDNRGSASRSGTFTTSARSQYPVQFHSQANVPPKDGSVVLVHQSNQRLNVGEHWH
jgi:hypothetical protein